jgi:hypothetical protein
LNTINGIHGIKATIILDSISPEGVRLTTFEIEVPRIVWAEFMTHRMFSRNASSSRAIPFDKMIKQLEGTPSRFGKNVAGMQDSGDHKELVNGLYLPAEWWRLAKLSAINFSRAFADAGYHKQISGRLTEPFQIIKAIVSATEFDNFFWLRCDEAADPTLQELANCMAQAYGVSQPSIRAPGEWHLPYISYDYDCISGVSYWEDSSYAKRLTLEEAITISCARCAAVSYRNVDYDLAKCKEVYERLVNADRKHSSAMEHCATPIEVSPIVFDVYDVECPPSINDFSQPSTWEDGVSHTDRNGNLWSGNFKGWVQYRKTIKGECYTHNEEN